MTLEEEFLQKARIVHGDKYDYSKVVYVNNKTKITINCLKHGEFEQRPSQHIQQKQGCPLCGIEYSATQRSMTTGKFITEAKSIFKDQYDYSNTVYTTRSRLLTIECHIHGEFNILPKDHLKGIGCSSCHVVQEKTSKNNAGKLYTTDAVIAKAIGIHGDRYDYGKVVYTNMNCPVTMICKQHGEFQQTFNKHCYSQRGCPRCGGTNKMTTVQFIDRAKKVHGDKYDYSSSVYTDTESKLIIICSSHGKFEQAAKKHLIGQGCRKCVVAGYFQTNRIMASKSCADWLKYISLKNNINIQSADNGGEYRYNYDERRWYDFDGYCAETNTCYEFYGDLFHGNPAVYHRDDPFPLQETVTMGDLYDRTKAREEIIMSGGFNLVTIWEKEWTQIVRIVKRLQKRWRKVRGIKYKKPQSVCEVQDV